MSKIAVIDWETTGLIPDKGFTTRYLMGPQGIQIGIAIVDEDKDFEIVAGYEANVRFLGPKPEGTGEFKSLTWSEGAFEVHGITPEELSRAQDVRSIAKQVNKFLVNNIGDVVTMCGHNPEFDMYFTKQLYELSCEDMEFRFKHRMIDTSTLGWAVWGTSSSYTLFKRVLGKDADYPHNAYRDAEMTALLLKKAVLEMKARKTIDTLLTFK